MLICSDFHVGEYAKDLSRIEYVKRSVQLDREFCAFLEYHASHRLDERPWRLVINGDFLDLVAVTFMPSEKELLRHPELELSVEERELGLHNDANKAVWKVEHVAARHRALMTYLADFVARGNHLELLYGNHDAEMYWPQAQQRLIELLVEAYFGGESVEGIEPEEFRARIAFHPWFFFVPGRIYIEHGNQYDDFSSFDHRLVPLIPFDQDHVAMPVSHLIIRYFVNRYENFRSHDKDNWTLREYVGWLRQEGWENTLRIMTLFGSLFAQVWAYADAVRRSPQLPELDRRNEQELIRLSKRSGIAEQVLRDVNAARNRPLETSFLRTMQLAAVDKTALVLLLCSAVLSLLASGVLLDLFAWLSNAEPFRASTRLLLVLLTIVLGVLAWPLETALLAIFARGKLSTAVGPKLEKGAADLARILDTSHIVFGHSHMPVQSRLRAEPECWYTNIGCWVVPERRERHDPECQSTLTYGLYDWDNNSVELQRWCTRENLPVPFSSSRREKPSEGPSHDALLEGLSHPHRRLRRPR
jgi:UDP-2,3-diacylglucosamine pyrophosphatase LpxH